MANIQPMEPENEKQGEFEEYDRPSKSSVKRDMLALQDLGKTLCEMPYDKVKRAPIGERLLLGIGQRRLARNITNVSLCFQSHQPNNP